MDCVIIRLIDMPLNVHGVTRMDTEGDYNIYINARLSEDGRAAAFRHEIEHIRQGHFYSEDPVEILEEKARKAI